MSRVTQTLVVILVVLAFVAIGVVAGMVIWTILGLGISLVQWVTGVDGPITWVAGIVVVIVLLSVLAGRGEK